MVDAEGHRGRRMEEPAGRAAHGAYEHAGPRAPVPAGPGPEPGPEDHHPFQTDVDDPSPLRVEAPEAREQDRDRDAQGGAERPAGSQVIGVGHQAGERERQEHEPNQGHRAKQASSRGGGDPALGGRLHAASTPGGWGARALAFSAAARTS